jgi:hypothetical protein
MLCVCAALSGRTARADDRALQASIGVGPGVGVRTVVVPKQSGDHRLATGGFPAFDLALRVGAAYRRLLFEAAVRYETSLGLKAGPAALSGDATGPRVPLRSHALSFGVAPGYRFARGAFGLSGHAFVGWAFRGLRSVAELDVPSYTLHGPAIRPEIRASFVSGLVELRVAPELLVLFASHPLRDAATSAKAGVGLGGELSLDLRVYEPCHLVLAYRGSYARISSTWSHDVRDVEHFATLRAELRY